MGVALAATLTFTNCSEEAQPVHETENVPYVINAGTVDTKTVNFEGYSTKWVAGDALNVFHAPAGSTEYGANTEFTLSDAEKGIFTTDALQGKLEDVNDWYVIYPYDERIVTPAATTEGYLNIAAKVHTTQHGYGLRTHLAGRLCPLYGVAKGVSDKTIPSITMNHLTSVACVEVTNNSGEDLVISSVTFTAPEAICGTFYIDITGEQPAYVSSGENYVSNTATVKVDNNGFSIGPGERTDIFVVIKPFTAKVGSELKIAVNGSEKVKVMDKDVTFAPGKIKTLKFSYEEVAEPVSIADVIAGGAGANVMTEGLVVATYTRGFILEDATGRILVYENETPSAAIGDKVVVSGSTSVYREFLQIVSSGVEVVSSGNPVNYPEPKVLDAAGMEKQLEATSIEYIQYTGSFEISNGKYYNVHVDGTTASVGSLIYPLESFNLADLDGKEVTVTGYNIGVNATKYLNTMAVSVEGQLDLEDCMTPDGKQWVYQDYDGYWHVLDFGVTTEGTLYNAFEPAAMEEDGDAYLYFEGEELEYEIIPTSVNSGTVVLTTYAYEEPISFEMTYEFTNGPTTMVVNESEMWGLEDVNAFEVTESIAIEMFGLLDTEHVSPDGKQWLLPENELLSAALDELTTNFILDLGVSWQRMYTEYSDDALLLIGLDCEPLYGEEAAGIWQSSLYGVYNVFNDDATSGVIMWNGIEIPYSDITETTCTFDLTNVLTDMLMYEGEFDSAVFEATRVEEFTPIEVMFVGGM